MSKSQAKLKFGILGFGMMGKTHFNNIQKHPLAEVTAIFSIPITDIKVDSKIKLYDNWKQLIDEAKVNAIVIATPTDTHAEIVKYAAQKGLNIFVEKPMARTLEECNEIVAISKKCNVKVCVGHVLRFWPSYSSVKCQAEMNQKLIGSVKMMRLQRLSGFPSWSNWFADAKKSGGVVLDLSIHDIDFACWTLGGVPDSVFCDIKTITVADKQLPGISFTTLDFGDAIAYCEASWAGKGKFPFTSRAEIVGSEGMVKFDGAGSIPVFIYSDTDVGSLDPYENDGYYLEMDSFISAILNDTVIGVPPEEGRNAVAVCLAAIKSAEEKRVVKMEEILRN
jgi:UDP-N-acetylglucosamine 3-dehydrogenase